jgi:hypothetical protein
MNPDDLIHASMRRLTPPDVPTADLMARALTRATRRRRIRLVVGAVVVASAIVAGTSVTTLALSGSLPGSRPGPADQPTTTTTPTGPIEELTGKALADALGLTVVSDCRNGMQQVNTDGMWVCFGRGWSMYETQLLSYQIRGYERTDTLIAMAEKYVEMDQEYGEGGYGRHSPDEPSLWQEYNVLRDQLIAEQGAHPYTGFESPDDEGGG